MVSTADELISNGDQATTFDKQDEIERLKEEQRGVSEELHKGDNGVTEEAMDETEANEVNKENGTSLLNSDGDASTSNGQHSNGCETKNGDVECIDLENEADAKNESATGPPPSKKAKIDQDDDIQEISSVQSVDKSKSSTPVPTEDGKKDDKKKEAVLTSPEALLDKLESYVSDAVETKKNIERKVLDALLGAINVQVQKEPLSVRKLILEKQLVLPNTISFPPSQVVDMVIEHDPEHPIGKVIGRMFGEERPKLSDVERKEKQQLKTNNPAPNMTKILMDIGQDLVQEATYCDIVHARNLPETPKNIDTYKQVAAQLKPVWEALRKKNEPYKMKTHMCNVCGFRSESSIVMQSHKSTVHYKNGKYQCALCPEFDTSEQRLSAHYLEAHLTISSKEEQQAKYPCLICEQDFQFKGLRDQHLRACKKDYVRVRHILTSKGSEDLLMVNRWLWDRPPIDPTILQQQQAAQAQQQKKTQQQQLVAAQAAQQAQAAAYRKASAQQLLLQQQLMQQQQQARLRQQFGVGGSRNAIMNQNQNLRGNSLIQAMQQHLQRTAAGGGGASGSQAQQLAAAQLFRKNFTQQAKNMPQAALLAAAAQAQNLKRHTPMSPSTAAKIGQIAGANQCEICDQALADKEKYLNHLQTFHKQMRGKTTGDMQQGAPLACSRCRDRFWTYEGLERHLVMSHGLVTADLLQKAQKKEDGGRCKLCGKQYAFNMLQHLVADHQVKLCSAEIMYSCDVCSFKCASYQILENHLSSEHPKGGDKNAAGDKSSSASTPTPTATQNGKKEDCITLDD